MLLSFILKWLYIKKKLEKISIVFLNFHWGFCNIAHCLWYYFI